MPIRYTSRKGYTYYLCKGVTKSGKPRYYFARNPKGESVEQIPDGYVISESINGIVSLGKPRRSAIAPHEIAAAQAAVNQHPHGRDYRVEVRANRIEVYEPVGLTTEQVVNDLRQQGFVVRDITASQQEQLDRRLQYTPVLRFILADPETRQFRVERMCYLGGMEGWRDIDRSGQLQPLALELIPKLGTDAFFEM